MMRVLVGGSVLTLIARNQLRRGRSQREYEK
jgi:hypothetical protein